MDHAIKCFLGWQIFIFFKKTFCPFHVLSERQFEDLFDIFPRIYKKSQVCFSYLCGASTTPQPWIEALQRGPMHSAASEKNKE